ncbi:putative LPLAT superfamily acyltransferase [Variovorax boronicumulans]|uniref:acyl-CoA synthetase n=1 Tax=Variovorax boronicumulans TaxID=436515 RepID=UPI002473673E|nr:acyl-CoA synthetase [Variovorax boronicumulans]MDH6168992.1 putative LPLAT superfamily acyltransferase [Variovorax boronicumulans]
MKHTDAETRAVNAAARTAQTTQKGGWTQAPERSNMLALRFICFMALVCGRHVTRLLLPPISLYFLLFAPAPRRQIKRYLFRAIGPHAGWIDGYRLLHAFSSTVLDRVYFLRGRMDLFKLTIEGNVPLETEANEGRGAFMLGAHVGSFEVMGACKHRTRQHDLRLAMLMYPDNAQRITAILNAIALPEMRPHVIALGRPHSMLALRDWLDSGGLGGMLADRTLPGSEDQPSHHRGNNIVLPFLGQPATFNDGPFRLAALLRRKVFFMAGLYGGGARYDIRFDPLADFTEPAADAADRERRIRAAVEAYVARLEALCRAYPYNWFNFHDFWLEDAA